MAALSCGYIARAAAICSAEALATIVDWPVEVRETTVRAVVDESSFWVGPSDSAQLLIVLDEDAGAEAAVAPDDVVTIRGHIRSADDEQNTVQLSPAAVDALGGAPVFVEGDRLRVVPR